MSLEFWKYRYFCWERGGGLNAFTIYAILSDPGPGWIPWVIYNPGGFPSPISTPIITNTNLFIYRQLFIYVLYTLNT